MDQISGPSLSGILPDNKISIGPVIRAEYTTTVNSINEEEERTLNLKKKLVSGQVFRSIPNKAMPKSQCKNRWKLDSMIPDGSLDELARKSHVQGSLFMIGLQLRFMGSLNS